jgi:hypothetical protein
VEKVVPIEIPTRVIPQGLPGGIAHIQIQARLRRSRVDFSMAVYKARSDRLRWDDLDFAEFTANPISGEALRCVRYMHDVEYHTVCYLRDLLVSPAHADPEVTSFLSFWVFEEFWHGEALAAVLEAHGEASGEVRVASMRQRLGWPERLRPIAMIAGSLLTGDELVAVHMAWGAINEWTTQVGYSQLARRAGHPVLSELLARIMRQEGRHIDFYASQAQRRLASSVRARRLTRFALQRFWGPVGSGVMPQEELRHLACYLMDGEDGLGAARRIDRRIDRLPGLEGLELLERSISSLQVRRRYSTGRAGLRTTRSLQGRRRVRDDRPRHCRGSGPVEGSAVG